MIIVVNFVMSIRVDLNVLVLYIPVKEKKLTKYKKKPCLILKRFDFPARWKAESCMYHARAARSQFAPLMCLFCRLTERRRCDEAAFFSKHH